MHALRALHDCTLGISPVTSFSGVKGDFTTVQYAGQAVVQMARSKWNPQMQYAIKFFLSRRIFEAEAALYQDKATPLGRFLPEVRAPGLCNPGGFVLYDIQQMILTNLEYFYQRVLACRALRAPPLPA